MGRAAMKAIDRRRPALLCCVACDGRTDFDCVDLLKAVERMAERMEFEMRAYRFCIFGVCHRCATEAQDLAARTVH